MATNGYAGKRLLDIIASASGLLLLSPILLGFMFSVWKQDRHSPFYRGRRVGLNGKEFHMLKLRSMRINADKSGVSSTSSDDDRITAVGHKIRRYKLDELTQLWNVLRGDMSLVGPRPQINSDVEHYSDEDNALLSVRPGITDFASIVFSDEGAILAGSENTDLDYSCLIRPWKIRLGLVYVQNTSLWLDLRLIIATAIAILDKKRALKIVNTLLTDLQVEPELITVANRKSPLIPQPLPKSLANKFKTR
jgi:lipopolysaccharide/colanic/teichoic acid biosynthesis glycosyltransferase